MPALESALIGAGINTSLNLLTQLFDDPYKNARSTINQSISVLNGSLIDTTEKASKLKSTANMFDSNIAGTLNSIAFKGRGSINPGAFEGAAVKDIIASKAQTLIQQDSDIDQFNAGITSQIMQLKNTLVNMAKPGFSFGSLAESVIGGVQAGLAYDEYATSEEKFMERMKSYRNIFGDNPGGDKNNSYKGYGNFNNFPALTVPNNSNPFIEQ